MDRFKRVLVLGLGLTGRSMIHYFLANNLEVFIADDNADQITSTLSNYPSVKKWGSDKAVDCIAISPGIARNHSILKELQGVPIVSDLDLLHERSECASYACITGTVGKSTTTALTHHLLQNAEVFEKVAIGGNIGIPVLELERLTQNQAYILELSSYQLDLIVECRWQVGVCLNISAHHLDRYESFEAYAQSKMKVLSNATSYCVVSADCSNLLSTLSKQDIAVPIVKFSSERQLDDGVSILNDMVYLGSKLFPEINKEMVFTILPSLHYKSNLACALLTALCLIRTKIGSFTELSLFEIITAFIAKIPSFIPLPHRMEIVPVSNPNIICINDSKATSPAAAIAAISSYKKVLSSLKKSELELHWILGGAFEVTAVEELVVAFHSAACIYLIGESTEKFATALDEVGVKYQKCFTLQNALQALAGIESGCVLLSPASPSLDQWKGFEERGNAFKNMAISTFEVDKGCAP